MREHDFLEVSIEGTGFRSLWARFWGKLCEIGLVENSSEYKEESSKFKIEGLLPFESTDIFIELFVINKNYFREINIASVRFHGLLFTLDKPICKISLLAAYQEFYWNLGRLDQKALQLDLEMRQKPRGLPLRFCGQFVTGRLVSDLLRHGLTKFDLTNGATPQIKGLIGDRALPGALKTFLHHSRDDRSRVKIARVGNFDFVGLLTE